MLPKISIAWGGMMHALTWTWRCLLLRNLILPSIFVFGLRIDLLLPIGIVHISWTVVTRNEQVIIVHTGRFVSSFFSWVLFQAVSCMTSRSELYCGPWAWGMQWEQQSDESHWTWRSHPELGFPNWRIFTPTVNQATRQHHFHWKMVEPSVLFSED